MEQFYWLMLSYVENEIYNQINQPTNFENFENGKNDCLISLDQTILDGYLPSLKTVI